mmetsp:Transcript_24855/g.69275  ORF Transcript_24855/g.69275 Transcript_24855/m.69275 type:complete len:242 (+) Transcript_24855:229-954(+)
MDEAQRVDSPSSNKPSKVLPGSALRPPAAVACKRCPANRGLCPPRQPQAAEAVLVPAQPAEAELPATPGPRRWLVFCKLCGPHSPAAHRHRLGPRALLYGHGGLPTRHQLPGPGDPQQAGPGGLLGPVTCPPAPSQLLLPACQRQLPLARDHWPGGRRCHPNHKPKLPGPVDKEEAPQAPGAAEGVCAAAGCLPCAGRKARGPDRRACPRGGHAGHRPRLPSAAGQPYRPGGLDGLQAPAF